MDNVIKFPAMKNSEVGATEVPPQEQIKKKSSTGQDSKSKKSVTIHLGVDHPVSVKYSKNTSVILVDVGILGSRFKS